jgi:mRNA-degrading endonuclease toxin of MazEF toxin-antitoxin module
VLTGKQFYKQKIHKAAHIKGLNSRQMDALNKALAFERDQRTASVHELLDKLRPVKIPWVKYLGIGSGVLIIIGLALWRAPLDVKQLSDFQSEQPPVITQPPSQTSTTAPVTAPTQTQSPITVPLPAQKPFPVIAPALPTQVPTPISSKPGYSSTSSDGIVHLQTSKPEYKNGEPFQLSFRLTQPMYVRVIDRDANGVVTTLRPNPRQPDKILPANKEHLFPPKGFNVPVKGPSGNCTVTIVASTQPFSKATELLNDDGSVSQQVQSDSYSWRQIRYTLHH